MAGPGANSLLNSASLQHSPPDPHFALYSTTTASCLAQQVEKEGSPCDAFCQSLHPSFLADFSDVHEVNECGDAQRFPEIGTCGLISGGNGMEDRLSARRTHKADREKLRRDKLNEQFSELASALDPDRPKNDKATILGESVQVVKDLRDEVKRLKTEHASLLSESHDLSQEKNELREEKATLKNETEHLQSQLHQRLRALPPWMALDPSLVMGAAAFPYSVPAPQPVSLSQPDSHQAGPPRALVASTPYMPLAPPLGAFPVHPNLQAYAMFGNRPGEGGNPFLPYPSFPQPVNSHSHIERPYAQYPSPIHPVTSYVVQMSQSRGLASQISPPSSGTPVYRPCVPGIPVVSVENHGSSPRSKESSHCEHVPTDPEQGLGVRASLNHRQATGSPVRQTQDRMVEPPSSKQKDVCSDMCQGKSPLTSVVPPIFSLEQNGLVDTIETRFAGEETGDLRSGSKGEPEQGHDPTLRPPAA